MGLTIAEKILSEKSGTEAKAGQLVVADIDLIMAHDSLGPMALEALAEMGEVTLPHPEKICFMTDHLVPTPARNYAQMQKQMNDFAEQRGIRLYGGGEGICHQLLVEKEVKPGQIVIGTDSHTCMAGALNALATGVGSTDAAAAMATGRLWFKVPETIKVILSGSWPSGVFAKDLILFLIGQMTEEGANYQAVEFTGEAVAALSMASRFTICNMGIEMGAKAAIMEVDEVTQQWLQQRRVPKKEIKPVEPDGDALYSQVLEISINHLEPQIAKPHKVDNVVPLKEVAGTPIHEVVIGTCTNGRLEDLEVAATILGGKHIPKGVRLIIIPASRQVLLEAMKKRILAKLIEAGGMILPPGCGPCVGVHGGIPADGENILSTANRNFKGRMGNPQANIFLGSPASAAAAALAGKIVDPRKYFA
ncbi:MAG: 3-isopropylmalate dehydratase large subunit [Thermodesulfobacteriota bacterium]